jgi:hypothetical protein
MFNNLGAKRKPLSGITNYQLPITNYQLPITNYQLPITNYQLPITNYQLPITNNQIMQNKANLLNTQMNVSPVLIEDYENEIFLRLPKNKPNQSQTNSKRSG